MRILVTNDDGVMAPALSVLASRLAREGHEVIVAAPLVGHSGCGASIGKVTEDELIDVASVRLPGDASIHAYSVDSPPAFIVLGAIQGIFGAPPDVVVTGPNSGLNLGPLTLHSGTLGAAITAASHGIPGIALSTEKRARFGFATAADYCAARLPSLVASIQRDTALNINVPDLPTERIEGVRLTRFAPKSLVAIVLSEVSGGTDGPAGTRRMAVSLEYDENGQRHRKWRDDHGGSDDSDVGAVIDRCISVTVVHGGLRHVDGHASPDDWQIKR